MQSVSSRIWTCVAVSFSYDDNHYTTGTSTYTHLHTRKHTHTCELHVHEYITDHPHTQQNALTYTWKKSQTHSVTHYQETHTETYIHTEKATRPLRHAYDTHLEEYTLTYKNTHAATYACTHIPEDTHVWGRTYSHTFMKTHTHSYTSIHIHTAYPFLYFWVSSCMCVSRCFWNPLCVIVSDSSVSPPLSCLSVWYFFLLSRW